MFGLKALVLFAFVAAGFVYESSAMSLSVSKVKVGIYYETMCPACKVSFAIFVIHLEKKL